MTILLISTATIMGIVIGSSGEAAMPDQALEPQGQVPRVVVGVLGAEPNIQAHGLIIPRMGCFTRWCIHMDAVTIQIVLMRLVKNMIKNVEKTLKFKIKPIR